MPDATTPENAPPPRPHKRRYGRLQVSLALLVSPLAFVFGTYVAALSLPALLPGLRRMRPFAVTLFAGVSVVFVLGLAGVNPVQGAVARIVMSELHEAFGGDVEYESITSDVATGTVTFRGLRMKLPQDAGELKARSLSVQSGAGYVLGGSYQVKGDGLEVVMDPSAPRLREFIDKPVRPRKPLTAEITDSSFRFRGRVSPDGPEVDADFKIDRLKVSAHDDAVELTVALRRIVLEALGARHDLEVMGGVEYRQNSAGVTVRPSLNIRAGEYLLASIQGGLTPDGTGAVVCTVDYVSATELWAAHSLPGSLGAVGRLRAAVRGPLDALEFDVSGTLEDVSVYHPLLMGLDSERAMRVNEARFDTQAVLRGGRQFELKRLGVDGTGAALVRDSALQATGDFELEVEQAEEGTSANLTITVTEGRLRRGITWSPLSTASLSDLRPSLLRVGDFLPPMRVGYVVEVGHLDVEAAPLSGVARGRLHGTAESRRGQPLELTVGGRLVLHDGRFEFLGASGEADVRLEYHESRPPAGAALRGELRGHVGDVPLNATLGGMLIRPSLTFTGMTMSPDELGRRIFRGGDFTTAQRRRISLNLCGPGAAAEGNPFLAHSTGKVRFLFR
jgi:hypothetical protein